MAIARGFLSRYSTWGSRGLNVLQTKRTRPVSGANSPSWSRAFESLSIAAAACAFAWASFCIAACDEMRGAE
jgi:hypothetical protein